MNSLPSPPPPPRPRPALQDPLWLGLLSFLLLLIPLWLPYLGWRLLRGNSQQGRRERFGGGRQLPTPEAPRAWFHGVSVGEVEALRPVVSALAKADSRVEIVLTTTTPTGRARLEALYPEVLDRRFAPLDLPWAAPRAVARIAPSVVILGESELWPSLLRAASGRAPVVVVNGRISDRTLPRALRLRPLYRWMLGLLTRVGVQTEEDRIRFLRLGLPSNRVVVTGNVKFDRILEPLTPEEAAELRSTLGFGADPVLVAGSTFPGEDELLLEALSELRPTLAPGLRLLLAPRHPERGEGVAALAVARGFSVHRRSQGAVPEGLEPDVVVLDTVGELSKLYGLGRVAVMGRSFRMGGGQNPLEPMAHGVPVVFGPRMENFREIAALAQSGGAALRCEGEGDLTRTLASILQDPQLRGTMAEAGPAILRAHQGASARSAALILEAVRAGRPSYP